MTLNTIYTGVAYECLIQHVSYKNITFSIYLKGSIVFFVKASLLCVVTPYPEQLQTKTHSRLNSSVMCCMYTISLLNVQLLLCGLSKYNN